jgi:hypothetical protein
MTLAPIPPTAPATPPEGNQGASLGVSPAPAPVKSAAPAGDTQAGGQPPVAAAPSPSTAPTANAPDPDAAFLEGQPDNLKELYKQLPPEIRAANNKVVTEKLQKVAGDVKLVEALKTNPKEFAAALAAKVGLNVAPVPTPAAVAAKSLTEELSPFFEGNTQAAAAFEGLLAKVIDSKLAPIQETHERATQQALLSEAQASEARFLAKHPDAKQYEAAIGEYMTKIQPGPDLTDDEFLEMAYSWATRDVRSAAQTVETVERLASGNAATAGTGSRSSEGAPVSSAPPQDLPTTTQAIAAALRGERWER